MEITKPFWVGVRCTLAPMTTADDTSHPHHDNAHSLTKGQSIGLTLFIVVGCLVGIYVGLMLGEYAHL